MKESILLLLAIIGMLIFTIAVCLIAFKLVKKLEKEDKKTEPFQIVGRKCNN